MVNRNEVLGSKDTGQRGAISRGAEVSLWLQNFITAIILTRRGRGSPGSVPLSHLPIKEKSFPHPWFFVSICRLDAMQTKVQLSQEPPAKVLTSKYLKILWYFCLLRSSDENQCIPRIFGRRHWPLFHTFY